MRTHCLYVESRGALLLSETILTNVLTQAKWYHKSSDSLENIKSGYGFRLLGTESLPKLMLTNYQIYHKEYFQWDLSKIQYFTQ